MSADEVRLGEIIDDYCPRCRLLLNHVVAGMAAGQAQKVVCQTCFNEHTYKYGKGGRRKPAEKVSLFDEVLAKMAPIKTDQPPTSRKRKEGTEARYITRHPNKRK